MSRPVWFQVIVHDEKSSGGDTAAAAFHDWVGAMRQYRLHLTHGGRPQTFAEGQAIGAAARTVLDPGDTLVFATRLEDDGPEHVHGWLFCGWDPR
jgi:hypothetical protein